MNDAFEKLKNQVVNAAILIHSDFLKDFEIYTYASGVGIGAILTHSRGGFDHPVAYAKKQLNVSERNIHQVKGEF